MGPAKVHSYMKNAAMYTNVKIATLARAFKERTGRNATVVVDGNQIMYRLYENCSEVEWLMGGQLKELETRTVDFIRAFKVGIDLGYVFSDGCKRLLKNNQLTI